MHDGCHRVAYSRLPAPPIARATLAVGFFLKFVLGNQLSAALATTSPGKQPLQGPSLLLFFSLKIVLENQFSAALLVATTAPAKQPANRIASQIAGATLAVGFLLKFGQTNQVSAALATTAPRRLRVTTSAAREFESPIPQIATRRASRRNQSSSETPRFLYQR